MTVERMDRVQKENAECGCACHTDVTSFLIGACQKCAVEHLTKLRHGLEDMTREFKKLNTEFVHANTASATLKEKVHDLLKWVNESSGAPEHQHVGKKSCFFCETAKKILDVIKENKIGDNIIKMLRQRHELLKAFNNVELARALQCDLCDGDGLKGDCSCEGIEEARNEADAILEKVLQAIRDQGIE